MQLSNAEIGHTHTIKGIWADADTEQALHRMGFLPNKSVTVLAQPFPDAVILQVGDTKRVSIGTELAQKIMI